jgi:hypothetical protein
MTEPHWTYWDRDLFRTNIRWWIYDLKAWLIHKLGGFTTFEMKKEVNHEHERWMKIILSPKELKFHQQMARSQKRLIKKMHDSMIYGTAVTKGKKLMGLQAFIQEGK